MVCRRFIAVFYPDCKISTTTVLGAVEKIEFKATGKQILESGWRVVFAKDTSEDDDNKENNEEHTLPDFTIGESGPHKPDLLEKWTQPPKPYTEATLLRAMETAGKLVDNDELRDALKENGIGRPSTRAAIIETLFKRRYIRKERKNLIATPTGVELIGIINEDLLKSAELTGLWEKKLREIEHKKYDTATFINELKQMVCKIVADVKNDHSFRHITVMDEETEKANLKKTLEKKSAARKTAVKVEVQKPQVEAKNPKAEIQEPKADDIVGKPCPKCGKGQIIKGRSAYGCSEWKSGCDWRKPFD